MGIANVGLGGAQSGLDIYQGFDEGDPGQVAAGVQQGLGAYNTANTVLIQRAFQQGLQEAAEMGLSGTAATQYANQAAEGAGLAGASSVGEWIPWVGTGLAAYNFAKDPSGRTAFDLGGMAVWAATGNPAAIVVGVGMGIFSHFMSKHAQKKWAKNLKPRVSWRNPELETIHIDNEGNYYLQDTGQNQARVLLRYNPGTNKLEQCTNERLHGDQPADIPETEFRKLFRQGKEKEAIATLDNIGWEEFDPLIYKPKPPVFGSNRDKWKPFVYYNVPSLQAQIYNQVLVPSGQVPQSQGDFTPVTLAGKRYWADESGMVFNSGGQIIGNLSEDGNNVNSFVCSSKTSAINDDGTVDPILTGKLNREPQGGELTDIHAPAFMDSEETSILGLPGSISLNRPRNDISVRNIKEDTRGGTPEDWDKWWLDNYGITFDEGQSGKYYGQFVQNGAYKQFHQWQREQTGSAPYSNSFTPGHPQGELYANDQLIGYVDTRRGHTYDLEGNYLGTVGGFYDDVGSLSYKEGDSLAIDFGSSQVVPNEAYAPLLSDQPPFAGNIQQQPPGDAGTLLPREPSIPSLPATNGDLAPPQQQPPSDTGTLLPGQAEQPTEQPAATDASMLLPQNILGHQPTAQQPPALSLSEIADGAQPQTDFLGGTQQPSSLGTLSGIGSIGGNNMSGDTEGTQTQIQAPGPLPAGGAAVWEMYLDNVFGSPGAGQASYLAQALAGEQQYRDAQNQQYVDAIQQNVQPYNQAIDAAKANPINISFGGKPVGNVMMGGGMAAEQQRLSANMLAPQAQQDYAQQNTPYTAFMRYADSLAKAGMDMQRLAYGVPSQTTDASVQVPGQPVSGQVGDWLNIAGSGLGALQTGLNVWDFGQNQGWWGGVNSSGTSPYAGFGSPWM